MADVNPGVTKTGTVTTRQMKFQPMSNIDRTRGSATATEPKALGGTGGSRSTKKKKKGGKKRKKDQLRMSDETGGHLEAIISDILMRGGGNSCCRTNILKLPGSISLITFADVQKKKTIYI